jgi:ribonuclease P protein component
VSAGALWCVRAVDGESLPPQIGFALGKTLGNAVTRNLLRRRLRALASERSSELPSGKYLIGARPAAAELSFDELRMMFDQMLRRMSEITS